MIDRLKNWLNALDIDFVGYAPPAAVFSILAVLASWGVFVGVGPNWGIDFTGGTEIHLAFHETTEIGEVRGALRELGLSDDSVQQVNDPEDNEFSIRIQDATFGSEEMRADVEGRLLAAFGDDWIERTIFDAEVGARMSVYYHGDRVTTQRVSQVLADMEGVVVQEGRDTNQINIKMPGLSRQIERQVNEVLDKEFTVLAIDAVGPAVGQSLRQQGAISVLATLALVLVYIAFRFDITFAPGAVLALFHDVSLTIGFFVLLQKEISLAMIGALLTIVGYSLNDTIVIYDRIRENSDRYARQETRSLINISISETVSRTLATSVTTFLAISAFLFMGGAVIQNFALAMLFGIIFGTYSTVFVASPTILLMERIRPKLVGLVAGGAQEEDDDESADKVLTETEKRRRERASHEGGAPSV